MELWLESKDDVIRDRLVARHLPLVCRLCRRFQSIGEPLDNLIRAGAMGFVKAIDRYDPKSSNKLSDFAIPAILEEIKDYIRYRGWGANVTIKLQLYDLLVARAVDTLTQLLGHSPTVAEIAESAGLSEEEVFQTFDSAQPKRPSSPNSGPSQAHGTDPAAILNHLREEAPASPSLDPEIDSSVTSSPTLAGTLAGVDPREQSVLYLKYYSGLPQRAIARRLGISRMHVSLLQRRAVAKLSLKIPEFASG